VDQDAVLKSKLYVEDDLNVGENTQLSGTIHVDQDAVLKSKLYVEDDLNVGENTQLSGTIHVDQDAVFRSGLFVEGNAQINGNLYVSGDRVIMETSTVRVEDKNIELAVLDSATDATADQGGITLKGTTDKTILWSNATDSWDLSENLGIADGKYIFSDKLRARDSAGLSLEDDGGNGIFIKDGGNVGIGTTSPDSSLHIEGSDNTTSQLHLKNTAFGSDPADFFITPVYSSNQLQIRNSSAVSMLAINGDGNVGIGTASPNEKLEVSGRIYIGNSSAPGTTTNRLYSVGGILYWDGENVLHARDTIGEMEDTSIGTKSNGQVLIWNATSSKWVNNALTGGNGIDVTNAAGGITISHTDTSSAASSNNSGRTYIQDIGLDTYGHVTSLATRTHSNAAITLTAGSGMSGGGSFDLDQSSAETITISHSDTSSQATSNNSGRTYIQDIGLDTYGHVTSLSTATETVVNTNTTYTAGTALGLSGTTFNVSADLIFATTPTIGTTLSKIHVGSTNGIRFFTWDGVVGNDETMRLTRGGDLHVNGDVLAFSSTISDERLKDNATEIKGALNKIEAMRGVSYTWNKGSRKGQKDIGVIAQEVEQVIPEIVREYKFEVGEFEDDETKYKTVDYEKLAAVLIEAVKELSDKLDQKTCCCCKANHNPKN
jgi:hypothetical protein